MGSPTTPRGGGIRPEAHELVQPHALDDLSLPTDSPHVDADLAWALAAGVARWGARAIVHESTTIDALGRVCVTRHVGRQHDAFAWAEFGRGSTWREAFDAADRVEGVRW